MEVFMRNIPYALDKNQLIRELEGFLHGPHFEPFMTGAAFNFAVQLFSDKRSGQMHKGCGALTVPQVEIGDRVLELSGQLYLHGRIVHFTKSKRAASAELLGIIRNEPYQDPAVVERRERLEKEVEGAITIEAIQFGVMKKHSFSVEWEYNKGGHLSVSHDTHSFVVKFGGRRVLVQLRNVISAQRHYDVNEIACIFTLETPPVFEAEAGILPHTHEAVSTEPLKRRRLPSLDESHQQVVSFLDTMRLTFRTSALANEFERKLKVLSFTLYTAESARVVREPLFSGGILSQFQQWLPTLEFRIAFQLEALLTQKVCYPGELLTIKQRLQDLIERVGVSRAALSIQSLIRRRDEYPDETIDEAFKECSQIPRSRPPSDTTGIFECHHITITPATMVLDGPYPDQTNRVIRKYKENEQYFIRVEFRDEDRLRLRWDRDVDGPQFLEERFGGVLRKGFFAGGRKFEFLAYSSSALKEHAVWFMTPFLDGAVGLVNGDYIRSKLGDFSKVIHCPARFGARLSQAFSATESSVIVEPEDMFEDRDIVSRSGSEFTDGCSRISQDMADAIWDRVTQSRSKQHLRKLPTPSAFQIRFGGCKGIFCVDHRLEGRVVCIRPSMTKFNAADDMEVEVARSFDRPSPMFLNRPLIMLLETLGIPLQPFLQLQTEAVNATNEAAKSMKTAARLFEQHGLGTAYHLTSLFLQLDKAGADLISGRDEMTKFLKRVLNFGVNHILRNLKYKARIPIYDACTLVGVADEHGVLEEGEVYACMRRPDGRKEYIVGKVMISRSPTVHPGDARLVRAIGKPPENSPFLKSKLTNCVVFSCKGERSLPSMLAGGDLDGDLFNIVWDRRLFPPKRYKPASYESPEHVTVPWEATINDVADFVVNFFKNDILGIIATQLMVAADKSPKCMADPDCIRLAQFHSDAVDFPKTGHHVSFGDLPTPTNRYKPDWDASETNQRSTNVYPSQRIIGHLFRAIDLPAVPEANREARKQRKRKHERNQDDPEDAYNRAIYLRDRSLITTVLRARAREYVDVDESDNSDVIEEMLDAYYVYEEDLYYTCKTRSLSRRVPLTEEEVVAGTIVAKCSQPRQRRDMMANMRQDATGWVTRYKQEIVGEEGTSHEDSLLRALTAWRVSIALGGAFGAKSFGLIALGVAFDAMRSIDEDDRRSMQYVR